MNALIFSIMALVFIALTLFLGWYGYKQTKGSDEFLLGTRKTNSTILALSYGATFISASAIVGFGGQAAKYGLSMVWLVFLNLFVGIVVAFLIFGKPTRRLGRKLKAFTFSDLLGKRFNSRFIRLFSAIVILVGMPVYCAAVMLGGVNFVTSSFNNVSKDLILILFAIITGVYVVYGGIIAVIYNDALQAGIMFVGMIIVGIVTFVVLGGYDIQLSDITPVGPMEEGITSFTSFPEFGSEPWWTLVSTFLLGVGIGALAQPQLVVRFMNAKSDKSMSKSLAIGSIFIFVIVGIAYTVGALTNVWFFENHDQHIATEVVKNIDLIIPTFINEIFAQYGIWGELFISLFILAILTASISTMSALLHTMGAAGSYDLISELKKKKKKDEEEYRNLRMNRIVTAIMLVVVVVVAYKMPSNIIAKATSIFMGLTAATLLPAYGYALFAKGKPSTKAAVLSIVVGAIVWVFWGFFVNAGIATVVGTPMIENLGIVNFVDPLVIALPLSVVALMIGIAIDKNHS